MKIEQVSVLCFSSALPESTLYFLIHLWASLEVIRCSHTKPCLFTDWPSWFFFFFLRISPLGTWEQFSLSAYTGSPQHQHTLFGRFTKKGSCVIFLTIYKQNSEDEILGTFLDRCRDYIYYLKELEETWSYVSVDRILWHWNYNARYALQ